MGSSIPPSLQATEEAIRVAQQSGDAECVCFANIWLALVSSSLGSILCGVGKSRGGGGRGSAGSVYASVGGIECSGGSLGNAVVDNTTVHLLLHHQILVSVVIMH